MSCEPDPCAGHPCDHCATCTGANGEEPRCCADRAQSHVGLHLTPAILAGEQGPTRRVLEAIEVDRHRWLSAAMTTGAIDAEHAVPYDGAQRALPPAPFNSSGVHNTGKDTSYVRPIA